MANFVRHLSVLIFVRHLSVLIFVVLVPIALSQDSPSPSPVSSPPTTTEVNSPPSPPPTESPYPTPSPSPSESHTPSPSHSSGLLDDNSAGVGKSEGMSGGRKAGIAFAVIVNAVVVVIWGAVYKKRRENIRRQQYVWGLYRQGGDPDLRIGSRLGLIGGYIGI